MAGIDKLGPAFDGQISADDPVYSQLRVWIDLNHDGLSEPGELHTLSEVWITQISTAYREIPLSDRHGNVFYFEGVAMLRNQRGHEVPRLIYDVFLTLAR